VDHFRLETNVGDDCVQSKKKTLSKSLEIVMSWKVGNDESSGIVRHTTEHSYDTKRCHCSKSTPLDATWRNITAPADY